MNWQSVLKVFVVECVVIGDLAEVETVVPGLLADFLFFFWRKFVGTRAWNSKVACFEHFYVLDLPVE